MKRIGVIGGIAVDLEGRPFGALIPADSNPGTVRISYGGVARNIAENLYWMGENQISFFSAIGGDALGKEAIGSLAGIGVDTEGVLTLIEERTAMYLSILDEGGEMTLALSDMSVLEHITPGDIQTFALALRGVPVIALDANLTEEALAYCGECFADRRIFIDPVSVEKARRIRPVLSCCYALKPNRLEAEALAGFEIRSDRDLETAGAYFLNHGVRMVFISLGKDGVFYMDASTCGRVYPPRTDRPVSVTGAGDAMSAAIADGIARDMTIRSIAENAVRAGSLAIQVQEPVNRNLGANWKR